MIFIHQYFDPFFRDHLKSDMSDEDLKFWTTSPNVFFVATLQSNGDILGCISYRQIDSTTVEMHRAQVKPSFRGLKIGRKLVQKLIDTAKENGYESMYLTTSSAQLSAIAMYTKMGFKFLKYVPAELPIQELLLYVTGGLKVLAFTYKL